MHLIVGLGNPGSEYTGTRHNAGFMAVNRLAQRHATGPAKAKFHASVLETMIGDHKVMLMQPTTYMNRSGQAVGEAARYFELSPDKIMVVVDETALPVGTIRLRPRGSAGGHNGLADIERALDTDEYPRLRIGVGEPIVGDRRIPKKDYVLGRFTQTQREQLPAVMNRAADALETWLRDGMETAMNRFNEKPLEQN